MKQVDLSWFQSRIQREEIEGVYSRRQEFGKRVVFDGGKLLELGAFPSPITNPVLDLSKDPSSAPTEVPPTHKPLAAFINVGEVTLRIPLESLKLCLVGSWKDSPNSLPTMEEMEEWVITAWRLKGSVLVAPLNNDLLLFEFTFSNEVKRVLEGGRRSCKGGMLSLEWWQPEIGRKKKSILISKFECVW